VRQGKFIELEIAETDETRAKARLDEMCRKLLANTVIENLPHRAGGVSMKAAVVVSPAPTERMTSPTRSR